MKRTLIACAVLALSSHAIAQTVPAGKVLAVAGSATLDRAGQQLPLQVGVAVQSGDILAVGDKSTLQVRFTDESVVALRANSQFKIENYKFDKNADSDRSLMGLLKGGMRTITGLIGKANNKNYAVQTATSTIGIRGTHFSVVSCNNDCTRPDGTPEANGTFGSVTDGRITVSNASGTKEFGQQDTFYVSTANTPPVQLLAPPAILSDKGAASRGRSTAAAKAGEGEASSDSGQTGGTRISTSPQLTEQRAPRLELIARITNVAASDRLPAQSSSSGEVTFADLQGFRQPNGTGNSQLESGRLLIAGPAREDVDFANAVIFNAQSGAAAISRFRPVSSSAAAGAYWYYVPPSGANSLGTHRAFGDAPVVSRPTSGIAQYNYVGGTAPTDNYGRVGSFSGANLVMNFGNQKVTNLSPMSTSFAANAAMNVASTYTIPVQNWSMSPGVQVLTNVTINCTPTCPGNTAAAVNGTFTGVSGQGYLLGTQLLNSQLKTATPSANAGGNVSVYARQ
ncbi:MAG: FecR family protein [Polaromonas sp.]